MDAILLNRKDQEQVDQLITYLNQHFSLKKLGLVNYFLGFKGFRDHTGLYLTQHKHIQDLLFKIKMSAAKPTPTPMCPSLKLSLVDSKTFDDPTIYRSTVGPL